MYIGGFTQRFFSEPDPDIPFSLLHMWDSTLGEDMEIREVLTIMVKRFLPHLKMQDTKKFNNIVFKQRILNIVYCVNNFTYCFPVVRCLTEFIGEEA